MNMECCICGKPIEPDQKGRYQALIGINLTDVYRAALRDPSVSVSSDKKESDKRGNND